MKHRWRKLSRGDHDTATGRWASLCAHMPLLSRYGAEDHARLRELTRKFLQKKRLEGAAELELNDDLRLLIGAQACVPILNLGLRWYDDWVSVIVYSGDFVARHQYVDEAGVVHEVEKGLSGEAWSRGPVVISLQGALDGARGEGWGNLIIHEFAHKLDLRNGSANGMPPLPRDMSVDRWAAAWSNAFDDFCGKVESNAELWIDDYGAEDPGEFFAVMSEAFFVYPGKLRSYYPEVYAELCAFYRQTPAGEERF